MKKLFDDFHFFTSCSNAEEKNSEGFIWSHSAKRSEVLRWHLQISSRASASSSDGISRSHMALCRDCTGDGKSFWSQFYSECRGFFGWCGSVRFRAGATKVNSIAFGEWPALSPATGNISRCSLFSYSPESPEEQFPCCPKRQTASTLFCERSCYVSYRFLLNVFLA